MFISYNPVSVGILRFFARRCSSVKERPIKLSICNQALAVKYFFMATPRNTTAASSGKITL